MSKARINSLWFFFILFCCTEAEEISYEVPRVMTNGTVLTSSTGAIFEAKVLSNGGGSIIQHGFQWREAGSSAIDLVNLGALDTDYFKTEVNTGFEVEKRYEVRAFIETEILKAYGEWIEFSGAGSLPPEITSVSPLSGTWGDTITIKGKYFSVNRDLVKVEFDDAEAEIVSIKDSELRVKVPVNAVKAPALQIVIKTGNKFARSNDPFNIVSTEVKSINPNKGGSGTIVTVKGKNFNTQFTTLKLGALNVPLDYVSKDSLKFKLPKEVSAGAQTLFIASGPFSLNLENGFFRNYPVVTEIIPSSAFYGDTITLRGENFGSTFSDNEVFASDQFANIISSKVGELKVVLPLVSSPEINFRITADYVSYQSEIKLKIKSPVITDILPHEPVYPGQELLLKGDYFFPGSFYGSQFNHELLIDNQSAIVKSATRDQIVCVLPLLTKNQAPASLVYFDNIQTVSNQSVSSPVVSSGKFPGSARVKSASFTIGSKSYVLTGIDLGSIAGNEVYVYDASNKLWTTRANFPGLRRYGATAFSLNDKGYILGGYDEFGNALRDVWEYNPASDSWTRKNDVLFHPQEAFNLNGEVFSLSDITYIIIPPSTEISGFGYNTEFWKYDPLNDVWIKKANPPTTLKRNNFYDYFTMQIDATLLIGSLTSDSYINYSYDIQNDQWIAKGLANLNGNSPITFEYGGAGYLLTNQFLYRYDVGQNKWTLLETGLSSILWQGGEATRFRANNSWYFMLFNYNDKYISDMTAQLRNLIIEFNCELAGF